MENPYLESRYGYCGGANFVWTMTFSEKRFPLFRVMP
jgi:hypothetical protein